MDLCLRGSQINLVERQKPRPKYGSQTNLCHTTCNKNKCSYKNNPNQRTRPHSAQFCAQRSRSSPFLNYRPNHNHHQQYSRPQSAEFTQFGFPAGVSTLRCNSSNTFVRRGSGGGGGEFAADKFGKNKRYQSISSSSLLKLLLDEPIKRSWLCRRGGDSGGAAAGSGGGIIGSVIGSVSSPDSQSEQYSATALVNTSSYYDYNKRTRTESAGGSSVDSERLRKPVEVGVVNNNNNNSRYGMSASTSRLSSANSVGSATREKSAGSTASTSSLHSTAGSDYWPINSAAAAARFRYKINKPDLPGRVSFSKPMLGVKQPDAPELCGSDGENEQNQNSYMSSATTTKHNTQVETSISAPGPVTTSNAILFGSKMEFSVAPSTTATAAANTKPLPAPPPSTNTFGGAKKSVHFGAPVGDGEGGIIAETYEYPKCPSENCSCSTRSSSTASSTPDSGGSDAKCPCDSPACKLAAQQALARRMSYTDVEDEIDYAALRNAVGAEQKQTSTQQQADELQVIRDYKSVIGEQLENSVVKQILEEDNKAKVSAYDNTLELPAYLEKYASPGKSANVYSDKPNNLTDAKQLCVNYKSGANKNNLIGSTAHNNNNNNNNELTKMENNNLDGGTKLQSAYATATSDTVINNYLKVAATTPLMTKKKENNRPSSGSDKQAQNNFRKSAATTGITANNTQPTKPKTNGNASLRKATSFSSSGLRGEEAKLPEFDIDKVDSWMSMHGASLNGGGGGKTFGKEKTLDADFVEQLVGEKRDDVEDDDDKAQAANGAHEGDEQAENESQVSTRSEDESTYDEIVSVIKEIEEDKKKDNYSEKAVNDLELKLNMQPETTVALPAPSTTRSELTTNETSKSPDKYKDILNYLANVEDSCDRTLLETRRSIPESNRSEMEFVVEPDIAEDVPKLADLLMLPNHQLARRVIALSLRANELANAVYLAKEHVIKVRTEKQKSIRSEKANAANRMREQKKHYETIVKRHQGFIEQLLKDKGSLCEKVAALTRRLESQNQAWEHKLETEIARVKETTLAGEKIRRERWVRENTKKIKELTVKGLETEINRMTCNHQREINELKQAHQQQLLDALEEARLKHEQIENSIRESCAQDREAIIEKERLAIRERFERQLEEERKCFDEQRRKLIEDFAAERERLQNELKAKDADFQLRRQELQREKELELEQTVAELQEKMAKQEEKYQNRINTIEKQYEADFEIWKRDYESECKVEQVEKENAIRQYYRAERDRQIDAIVSRMDAEALKHAEEHELKLNRLRDKFEKDLQLAENSERLLREKYTETRNTLAEADAKVRNAEAELKQLQMELEHSKKMCNDFIAERDQLRDNLRNEVQTEVAAIKMERDNEIQQIHKRVQQAIEKKDTTIDLLQKENGSLRERCLKLEAVIRQQRKDYCVK